MLLITRATYVQNIELHKVVHPPSSRVDLCTVMGIIQQATCVLPVPLHVSHFLHSPLPVTLSLVPGVAGAFL
mgnify:CR=1 FL=1